MYFKIIDGKHKNRLTRESGGVRNLKRRIETNYEYSRGSDVQLPNQQNLADDL